MAFFQTLRRVLANLQEGRPAEAVRTDEPVVADAAFRQRLHVQATTDTWLQLLLPALPAHLHAALLGAVVHVDTPVTTLPALLHRVAQHRDHLQAELDRAGLPCTAADQTLLDHLAELLVRLPDLAEPGAARSTPPRAT